MPAGFVDQENAVRILNSGGVLLMDTDTLPGFHCRADRPAAIERIVGLKGRGPGKPLLVLAGSLEQAGQVTMALNGRQKTLCTACWPGPFSIILPAEPSLAAGVTGGADTVAVRVPGRESLRRLILAAGFPLVSTSVNLAGQEPVADLTGAVEAFLPVVDGVVEWDDRAAASGAEQPVSGASALVNAMVWPPEVLRKGPRPLPDLDQRS